MKWGQNKRQWRNPESGKDIVLKSVHSTKFEILKEMDNFINRFHIPRLNEIKTTNLKRHKHEERIHYKYATNQSPKQ